MIFSNLITKMFICQCDKQTGLNNIKQLEGNRIVGRCLKCNKRVYAQFLLYSDFKDNTNGGENNE